MDRACAGKAVEQFPETKAPSYNNAFNEKQKAALGAEEEKSSEKQTPTAITSGSQTATSSQASGTANAKTPPDVTGKTLEVAKELLRDWKAGSVTEYSSTVPKDSVIRQYIASDGMVVVVLSTGPKTN